ncbi:MAG: hypothetical protein VKL41_17665 [Snowella sp.]|nr:hypothetical protein [Snowella sp.]
MIVTICPKVYGDFFAIAFFYIKKDNGEVKLTLIVYCFKLTPP